MVAALRPREVRLLAAEYDAAPSLDEAAVSLWEKYRTYTLLRQAELADSFNIHLVSEQDPYTHGRQLLADLVGRAYKVPAPAACPVHPLWDGQGFGASRTVHDIDGHGAAGSYFDLEGEILTLCEQAERLRAAGLEYLIPVVFSDTMQQLCSTLVNRSFAPQKVVVTEYDYLIERCLS